MKFKEFLYYWPTAIVVVVILYATLSNDPIGADELPPIPYLDKLIHAIMLGGLLSAIGFDRQRLVKAKAKASGKATPDIFTPKYKIYLFIGVAIAGLLDELLQGAVDNCRSFEFADFLADCFGEFVALLLAPPAIRKVLGVKKSHR